MSTAVGCQISASLGVPPVREPGAKDTGVPATASRAESTVQLDSWKPKVAVRVSTGAHSAWR